MNIILKENEVFNNISDKLHIREIVVTFATTGTGTPWASYQQRFRTIEEAQAECAAFVKKEWEYIETNPLAWFRLTMELCF